MDILATTFATAVTGLRRRLRRGEPPQLASIAWQVRLHAARRSVPVFGPRRRLAA